LQQQLTAMGFNAGTADGLPGTKTQTAIRRYQVAHKLPADGYASSTLVLHVEQTYTAAIAEAKLKPSTAAPTFSEDGP